jgi:hypothetical protein
MSLSDPKPVKTFKLGVIASKSLDDPGFLPDLLGDKTDVISHIYTNGANPLVTSFALEHGIPYTVYPITAGRGLPLSTRDIVMASEFVYIISTPDSKSASQVEKVCAQWLAERPDVFKGFKVLEYDSISHWKGKVCKAAEILACMSKEDTEKNGWFHSIMKAIS